MVKSLIIISWISIWVLWLVKSPCEGKNLSNFIVNTDLGAILSPQDSIWIPSYHWPHTMIIHIQNPKIILPKSDLVELESKVLHIKIAIEQLKKSIKKEPTSGEFPLQLNLTITNLDPLLNRTLSRLETLKESMSKTKQLYGTLEVMLSQLDDYKPRHKRAVFTGIEQLPAQSSPDEFKLDSEGIIKDRTTPRSQVKPSVFLDKPILNLERSTQARSYQDRSYVTRAETVNIYVGSSPQELNQQLMSSRGVMSHVPGSIVTSNYQQPEDITTLNSQYTRVHWINRTEVDLSMYTEIQKFVRNYHQFVRTPQNQFLSNSYQFKLSQLVTQFKNMTIGERTTICHELISFDVCDDERYVIRTHLPLRRYRRSLDMKDVCAKHAESGLLSYDWSFFKWAFGTADNNDLNSLLTSICQNKQAILSMSGMINEKINSGLSATAESIELLSNNTIELQSSIKTMAHNMAQWSDKVKQQFEEETAIIKHHDISIVGLEIMGLLTSYDSLVNSLSIKMEQSYRVTHTLITSLIEHRLPIDLITPEILPLITGYANNATKGNFKFIPSVPLIELISKSRTNAFYLDNALYFTTYIPMVTSEQEWQYWEIRTIPIPLLNHWMKLDINYRAVGLEKQTQNMILLTEAEWFSCSTSSIKICPIFPIIAKPNDQNCLTGLLKDEIDLLSRCPLAGLSNSDAAQTYTIMINDNSWLLTTIKINSTAVARCSLSQDKSVSRQEMVVGIQIVTVPFNCFWEFDNITLNPRYPVDYTVAPHKYQASLYLESAGNKAQMGQPLIPFWQVGINLSAINLPSLKALDKIDFENPRGSLLMSNITRALQNNNVTSMLEKLYAHHISLPQFEDNSNNQFNRWSWSPSWSPLGNLELWLGLIVNFILICFIVVCTCRRNSGSLERLQAGTAGISLLPIQPQFKSLAQLFHPSRNQSLNHMSVPISTIVQNSINITSTTPTPSLSQNHSIVSTLNQTLDFVNTTCPLSLDNSWYTGSFEFSKYSGELIMIGVMIICHYIMYRCHLKAMKNSLSHAAIALGAIPTNLGIAHHLAEMKITFIMIVQIESYIDIIISHITRSKPRSRFLQVAIQLCTLPGSVEDWVVVKQLNERGFLKSDWCPWYSHIVEAQLKWGPFCIRRSDNLYNSACENLPHRLRVKRRDILAQVVNTGFRGPLRLKLSGLSRIQFNDNYKKVVVYEVGVLPKGNHLANLQMIPLEDLA